MDYNLIHLHSLRLLRKKNRLKMKRPVRRCAIKPDVVCLTSYKFCRKTDVYSTGHSQDSHAHDIRVDATSALTCGDLCRVSASFGCSSKHFPGSLWAPTVPPLFTRIARIALRWRTCLLSRASGLTASRAYPGLGSTLRCTGCVGLRTTPPL